MGIMGIAGQALGGRLCPSVHTHKKAIAPARPPPSWGAPTIARATPMVRPLMPMAKSHRECFHQNIHGLDVISRTGKALFRFSLENTIFEGFNQGSGCEF